MWPKSAKRPGECAKKYRWNRFPFSLFRLCVGPSHAYQRGCPVFCTQSAGVQWLWPVTGPSEYIFRYLSVRHLSPVPSYPVCPKTKILSAIFPFSVYSSEIKKGPLNWISLWKFWDLWYSILQLKFNLLQKAIRLGLGHNNNKKHFDPLLSNINCLFFIAIV